MIQRSCETCVSQAVSDLMSSLGTVCLVLFIVVLVLVILLVVMIQLEAFKRKMDFKDKLGSAADNLPLKALDRMIETLQRTVKAMEKEFKM